LKIYIKNSKKKIFVRTTIRSKLKTYILIKSKDITLITSLPFPILL